jgi:hypothetical protein
VDELPNGDPEEQAGTSSTPNILDKSVIALPLLRVLAQEGKAQASARTGDEPPVSDLVVVIECRAGKQPSKRETPNLTHELTPALSGSNRQRTPRW